MFRAEAKGAKPLVLDNAGVLAGLVALACFLAASRDPSADLGSVSGSWIAERRATNDRES